jgi:hypothetical protein
MKTKVPQLRKIGNYEFSQRTVDGFFNASELLNAWNATEGNVRRRLDKFLQSPKTQEFIDEIKKQENPDWSKSTNVDYQVVSITKGRVIQGNGRTPDKVWMHPFLFIDFAMWINPEFKYHVIKFVHDNLIKFREDCADLHKELSEAVMKLNPPVSVEMPDGSRKNVFQYVNLAINTIVFGVHKSGIRNEAEEDEKLDELRDLQKFIINLVESEIITTFAELQKILRRKFNDKYSF